MAIFTWGLNRSADLWEKPEEFDPYRFLRDTSKRSSTYAWTSFGGGPRVWYAIPLIQCCVESTLSGCRYVVLRMVFDAYFSIGNNFSLFEQHLFLAHLLQRFSIHACAGVPKQPDIPGFGLAYPRNLSILLQRRTS